MFTVIKKVWKIFSLNSFKKYIQKQKNWEKLVHACALFYYSVTCYGCYCSLANLALPHAKYFLLRIWHNHVYMGYRSFHVPYRFQLLTVYNWSVDAFEPLLSTAFRSLSAGYCEEIYSNLFLWLCPLVLPSSPTYTFETWKIYALHSHQHLLWIDQAESTDWISHGKTAFEYTSFLGKQKQPWNLKGSIHQ
jgi:hypothetical protein